MRFAAILFVNVLLTSLFAAGGVAQAAPDWATHVFEYVQPDATNDATSGTGAASWADLSKLSISMLPDGTIAMKIDVGATTGATGQVMYNIDWKVGEEATLYQTGMIVTWAGGTVAHSVRGGWSGATTVGTPTFSASGKYMVSIVKLEDIASPEPGTKLVALRARTGAMASGAPAGQTGAGSSNAHDTLTPSVEPKDFTLGGGASLSPELLSLTGPSENVTAEAGTTATIGFSITNTGAENASVDITVSNSTAPDSFNATVSPLNGTIESSQTMNASLEVKVPADAEPGSFSWDIKVLGVNGGNATITLTLLVTAPSSASTGAGTSAGNATTNESAVPKEADGGGIPGPSLGFVLAVMLATVVSRRRRPPSA